MPKVSKLSKKLNARKGQIIFLLSGIHSHLGSLISLISVYILEQARSENREEQLTKQEQLFLGSLKSTLEHCFNITGRLINQYQDSTLIKK